jgi:dTDP-4-amino-4,6-dideoxygalactose transaminase
MRATFLPFSPPDISEAEIEEVVAVLRSGWITTGPRTKRFEEAFASFIDAEAALALSSGTAALHVALLAAGVGYGDAVIVPAMTFASAVHVVEHVGATPLIVDIDPTTLNIDTEAVRAAIAASSRPVRAIIPVHLHGQPCDLPTLIRIADEYDLVVIDDAAHAIPARIDGRLIGGSRSPRVMTAFSFYATKNLTTGEGGMLTGPRDLVENARAWSLHGMSSDAWRRHENSAPWRYDVVRAGFKYNFTDIQAALGLIQLERLPGLHARRRQIASRYTERFASIGELEVPEPHGGAEPAWHIYAIRLHLERLSIDRDVFIRELGDRNIGTSVHFIPIHTLTYYASKYGLAPHDRPVASREFERMVSLPIHTRMSDDDVEDVTGAVADVIATFRR